jgi:hypothetical protein
MVEAQLHPDDSSLLKVLAFAINGAGHSFRNRVSHALPGVRMRDGTQQTTLTIVIAST